MFLAPPLPPDGGKRGWRRRLLSLLGLFGLGTTALGLLVVNLVLLLVHYYLVVPTVAPRELYHRAWQMARDNIYDQSRLRDWDQWEHRFDDKIETEEDAIRYASEMIASLNEVATNFMDARAVKSSEVNAAEHILGVGISFELKLDAAGNPVKSPSGKAVPVTSADGYPLVKMALRGSPAWKAGIKAGDAVTSIDGKLTIGWTIDDLTSELRGKVGTSVTLGIRHAGTGSRIALHRAEVGIPIVSTARLPGNIGYIRLETFDRWDTADQLRAALEELSDCDAFIIDVRDNTGGFIHSAVESASYFLDKGTITTIEMRVPESGYFKYSIGVNANRFVFQLDSGPLKGARMDLPAWMLNLSNRVLKLAGAPARVPTRVPNLTGQKPVVLLVSDWTASAGELFTAALKDNNRVTVIGIKTFGKAIGQTFVPVANGCRLRITNQKLWTPNGDWIGDCGMTVSNGVKPDIVVEPAPGLVFGEDNDNQLKVAVEFLTAKLANKP